MKTLVNAPAIIEIRGAKVMLDRDLANLYGVETKALNQAVKRNAARFPSDFAFQLTEGEWKDLLRSQTVTSNVGRGGRRVAPYVFTEHGVAMLSAVLHSETAIQVSIQIVRAFVRARELLAGHAEILKRLDTLEKKTGAHDVNFRHVFEAIRALLDGQVKGKPKKIGFDTENKK